VSELVGIRIGAPSLLASHRPGGTGAEVHPIGDRDPVKARRASDAMMKMVKFDIAAPSAACAGAPEWSDRVPGRPTTATKPVHRN